MITVAIAAELLEEYTAALTRITATLLPPPPTSRRRNSRRSSSLPKNHNSSSRAPNYTAFLLNF
ncbi:hypothetical protein ISN44_As11g024060 [Arabidopsis suecica]|uniref:Uncharacterized protein n=1 Tax=Arabidopsis suecica TaxID=45249 RepID=A0A8T1ZC24_ARASU|nr:hypothetical protein ISN44_As11g024060 [Arabidopsis suecica]